jgi:flavin-dependent dehydrogenase
MSQRTAAFLCALAVCGSAAPLVGVEYVMEAPKEIPVAADVDVVVVGGSSGAVSAACEIAEQGRSVFLVAPRPYLGTDMCSTLRLWLEEGERPNSKLAAACFGKERVATPFAVKAAMDRALLTSEVPYLTGCYVTDVLRNESGHIAGIVMANRSGRQAIRAKVVVDATLRAGVARQGDVAFRPFVAGPQTFARVVVGGEMRSGDDLFVEKKDFTYDSVARNTSYRLPVYEYTLTIEMKDNRGEAYRNAEQVARDMTYLKGSEMASEVLSQVPRDTIIGERRVNSWPGAENVDLGPFRPKGMSRLFVLGTYADLGGEAAGELRRPLELMELGRRIGRAAAREAAGIPSLRTAALPQNAVGGEIPMTVGENLDGIRTNELGTIRAGRRALPVLGRYDVVVVGGGTSGAPAGIAAAKSGARTLVVEYLHELGGTGTVGLIGAYWYGLRRGYTNYVDEQVNPGNHKWNAVEKAEWLRQELRRSGADVWFGTIGCGALASDGQVCGVVVATPHGRGAVLAATVMDATGNADIAACAGAQTQYGISATGSLNIQIAGFPERPMKRSYVNTCYTIVDDTDVLDVWHLMAWRRTATERPVAFDVGQLVDSRDRRRIVGDTMLTVPDILNRRTFPDTISQHFSNFDAAAFPDSRLLLVADAKGPRFHTDVPYRCLLPKGIDGMLVVGLGCSAERDAMTLIRMQADMQNQGYAAGLAAAAAARLGGHTREVDIKALQRQLIDEGVLDERVLTDDDSYPMSPDALEKAVNAFADRDVDQSTALSALAVIMAHGEQATALLRSRYQASADGKARLKYAQILGILGDPAGAPALIAAVDACDEWDRGVTLTSQRKTGNTFSELDRLIMALGCSRATAALKPLIEKLSQLRPESELSHFKAISLALRHQPRSDAVAGRLVEMLKQPGFAGHARVAPVVRRESQAGQPSVAVARRLVTTAGDQSANKTDLNKAYKELIVAAMLYRCGDRHGMAKATLEQYAQDFHGHFARYAQQTLRGTMSGQASSVQNSIVEDSEPPEGLRSGGSTLVPRVSTPATQTEFGAPEY